MKPKTYRQLYVHIVFAVKYRQALLIDQIRPNVFKYMSGIITELGHKSINVDGMPDHVHLLVGLNPVKSISETVGEIKRATSFFINQEKLCPRRFRWQEGYGVFSVSHTHLKRVYQYILNQQIHHERQTFRDEYLSFLEKLEIEYDEKYLFQFFNDV